MVAVAGTAEDAIEVLAKTRVDIVMLDLEMPGCGRHRSIPAILEAARGAQVLIVSTLAEEGADATVAALSMGAADTLPKPGTGRFNGTFSEVLAVASDARSKQVRAIHIPCRHAKIPARSPAPRPMVDGPVGCLALGASTGGMHALVTFFHHLPERQRANPGHAASATIHSWRCSRDSSVNPRGARPGGGRGPPLCPTG